MTDQQMEERLEKAVSHAVPDDLEEILSRCGTQKGNVISMKKQKSGKSVRALIAACLTLVLVGGVGGVFYQQANAVASIVSLDVNPSVELKINKSEKVLSAVPVNEDGEKILEGMKLKGVQADVAVNAIIGALLQQGYVDELANSILITVEDDDVQRGVKLQQELAAQADAALAGAQIHGAILSQTLKNSEELEKVAAEYGVSTGKAALIQLIAEGSGNTKTFESLVGLTINELNLLYSAQRSGHPVDDDTTGIIGGADGPTSIMVTGPIESTGTANQGAYIGIEAAKRAALKDAGLLESEVTFLQAEYDYDDGRMIYEVEFRAGLVEHDYDIDALTGKIVKHETDREDSSASVQPPADNGYIGEQAAKDAALKHAGVKLDDTKYCNVWLEYDDGQAEYYEVEFATADIRYEYEIALTSGEILNSETEKMSGQTGNVSAGSADDVGREQAKAAALKHAGIKESQTTGMKVERELDDGRLEYSVEFRSGDFEYDYTIDGANGTVLEFEKDTVD